MQVRDQAGEVSFSPMLRRYTLEEFWALPEPADRYHYDLIEGVLYMVPPPDPPHGSIDSRLKISLIRFMVEHNVKGEVLHPREGIYRDIRTATYLEPDMMYVSERLTARKGKKRTSADIVFGYSSRSTAIYDRTAKADTYLALGIRELWLVDTENASIEVRYARQQDNHPFWLIRNCGKGEWAESEVLPGWRVSVDELFEGLV
ncbi:MAG TPA: Uma2 family endonuclease [Pyrinomonadaceae bacterium]|nr:Uma2 family endonuclease [Pyrinomonadaceae bacterium]